MRSRRRLVILVSVRQFLNSDASWSWLRPIGVLPVPFLQSRLNILTVNIVIEMKFETGDEKLKDLETGVFVGAGRFVVEKGKPVVVEYKISKAAKGN